MLCGHAESACPCWFACREVEAECSRAAGPLNELQMWHGTGRSVVETICQTGFDMRVSNRCLQPAHACMRHAR